MQGWVICYCQSGDVVMWDVHRVVCQKLLGCGSVGQSLGGQMAAAVLMSPHVVQFERCWLKTTLAFSHPDKFFVIACLV